MSRNNALNYNNIIFHKTSFANFAREVFSLSYSFVRYANGVSVPVKVSNVKRAARRKPVIKL